MRNFLSKHDEGFNLVLKGAFYNFLTNMSGSVISLVSTLLVAKYFGSSALGTIAIFTAILAIANLFANFGFSQLIVRLIPEYRSKLGDDGAYTIFLKVARLQLIFIFITTCIYYLLLEPVEQLFFSSSRYSLRGVMLLSVVAVSIGALYSYSHQTIRGLKQVGAYNLLDLTPRIMFLVLIVAVILTQGGEQDAIYAKLIGSILSAIVALMLLVHAWRQIRPKRLRENIGECQE